MRRVLHKGSQTFYLVEWYKTNPNEIYRDFPDKPSAFYFLHGYIKDYFNMNVLRDIYKEKAFRSDLFRLNDQEILKFLAQQLVSGMIKVVQVFSYLITAQTPGLLEVEGKYKEENEPAETSPKTDKAAEISITNPRWEHLDEDRKSSSPDKVLAGDEIILMADVAGIDDGAKVTFTIYDLSITPPEKFTSVVGKNHGGVAKTEWLVEDLDNADNQGQPYKIAFEGMVNDKKSNKCEIEYETETGKIHIIVMSPMLLKCWSNRDLVIIGNGLEITGATDDNGEYEYSPVPYGDYDLKIGEYKSRISAIAPDETAFEVPVPASAFSDLEWSPEDIEQEGNNFEN